MKKAAAIMNSVLLGVSLTNCESQSEETPPRGDAANCIEGSQLLDSLSEVGDYTNVSAAEVIASIALENDFIVQYATENTTIEQSPLGGETTLSLRADLSDALVTEYFPVEGVCPSRLEILLSIRVETSDGSLQETWPARLVFETGGNPITLYAEFDPENFEGSLEVNTPDNDTTRGTLTVAYETDNIWGDIVVSVRPQEDADTNSEDGMAVGFVSFQHILTWVAALSS